MRPSPRRLLHFCAATFVMAAVAAAPSPAGAQSVIGRVLEAGTRRPLSGVLVALLDSAGTVAASTQSEASGDFFLDAPAPGRYSLAFTRPGAATLTMPARELAAGADVQSEYVLPAGEASPAPGSDAPVYLEFQVQKPVRPARHNPFPAYPVPLAMARLSGEVLVQFVVDTVGQADMRTFKILRQTHTLFGVSVREALPRYRFIPAEIEGRKVRQLVQRPFKFEIRGATRAPDLPPPGAATRGRGVRPD